MGKKIRDRYLPVSLLMAGMFSAGMAMASSEAADAAFEKGNEAFRNGSYVTALASYNDALVNGKNTPRLHYNMGLAHFRLEQYAEARQAFTESAKDERTAALSYYHLGVLAHKAGDNDAAASWFNMTRRSTDSERLRDMSIEALGTIGAPPMLFDIMLSAGFGNDSNAFRAPNEPYTDFSQDPPVLVTPIEQSGSYVPIRIGLQLVNPTSARSSFLASYRHRGDYYTDSALENANIADHRVSLGLQRYLSDSRSEARQFNADIEIRNHAETNVDRDDGLDRFDDGVSIADRFDYNSVGTSFELKNYLGETRYELDAGFTQRDYEDVPTASSYDLSQFWFRGTLKYPLGNRSRVKFGAAYFVRSFDERRSRDLTGDSSGDNPTLEYGYQMIELGIRHRFSRRVVTEFTYSRTNRTDEFVGYNDYDRDRIEWETDFEISDKFSMSFDLDYRDQQYPNAFAFNDPAQAAKEYQDTEVSVGATYRLTDQLAVRANFRSDSVESSDPRGEYDRQRTRIGIYWRF